MTQIELLQAAKPILFNTEMVRAILDGHKTVTRRVIKQKAVADVLSSPAWLENPNVSDKQFINCLCDAPYSVGDTLWVQETWQIDSIGDRSHEMLIYFKAVQTGYYGAQNICALAPYRYAKFRKFYQKNGWQSPYFMPKEAARLFLRVTDVRVERLQDIMKSPYGPSNQIVREGCIYGPDFIAVWENTIKPIDRPHYGWDANPWVWVIEFERVEVTAWHGA